MKQIKFWQFNLTPGDCVWWGGMLALTVNKYLASPLWAAAIVFMIGFGVNIIRRRD